VRRFGSGLPDAVIWTLPVPADVLAEVAEHLHRLSVECPAAMAQLPNGIDHLAVDVELQLPCSRVSNAHGPGVPMPGEMRELSFVVGQFAVHVIENAELGARETGRVE